MYNCMLQAAWEVEDKRPSENWPEKGEVKFVDYGTRYREGLDLVIKGIDCTVNPGEKVSYMLTNHILESSNHTS